MDTECVAFGLMAALKQYRTALTAHPTVSPVERLDLDE